MACLAYTGVTGGRLRLPAASTDTIRSGTLPQTRGKVDGAPCIPVRRAACPRRIRLRFRLVSEGSGTWIALMGHLIGKEGELPYFAYEHPLAANLAALQEDLLAAPATQAPQKGRKKRR